MKKARNQLDDQAASSRGRQLYLERQITTNKAICDALNEQIDALFGDDDPSNDHFAMPLQIDYDQAAKAVTIAESELATIQETVSEFDTAVQKLDIRLKQATTKCEELRAMEKATKVKQNAAKALGKINIGPAPDVSGAEAKMMQDKAVADNALKRSMDGVTDAIGGPSSAEASAAAALAARRARIDAKKSKANFYG